MRTPCASAFALAMLASGCSQAGLPPLPKPDAAASLATGTGVLETATMAQGTATDVYVVIARNALRCWFGPDGPLRATHVFQAEAEPPAQGGAAEITVYERDVELRDQRGPRALRIGLANDAQGVRVAVARLKIEPAFGEAMAKDVETWVKGGSACHLRALAAATAPPQAASGRISSAPSKR